MGSRCTYLHRRGSDFRDDVLLAPLVTHSISAGLYPCRSFDVAHPITYSDAWLVESLKEARRGRQTKKRDDAAVKVVNTDTYLDHSGHGCRVEGGWINWRGGCF